MDISIWLKDWAVPLSAGITLLLAIAAFLAILQNHNFQRREKKERLLNEIIEWAEDIKNASVIPDFAGSEKIYEVNTSMRYGNSLSKAISIETIIAERFKEELFKDFCDIISALTKFMCIKQYTTSQTLPSEQGFPKDVIDNIKNEISKEPIQDLFIKYAAELTGSVNNLLKKANKIKAEI